MALNLGKEVKLGRSILVLGGGNVAFDCGRGALWLGAAKVCLACLESRDEMLASPDETIQGEEEGIEIYTSRSFSRITNEDGRITGVECFEVKAFGFDEDGNAEIETISGSEHVIEADTVILAIGQRPDIPGDFILNTNEKGLIEVDPYTLETSQDGVFAAGDAVIGTSSLIEAIASGRKAAVTVDRYLGGEGEIEGKILPDTGRDPWLGPWEGFSESRRCRKNFTGAAERINRSCGIAKALEEEEAVYEASRCLRCDMRPAITPIKFWGEYQPFWTALFG